MMRQPTGILVLSLLLPLLLWGGCGQAAFSPHFPDNTLTDLLSAMAESKGSAQSAAPRNGLGKHLVFLVTRPPEAEVVAYDLDRGAVLWRVRADVTSKVTVGRTMVFFRTGTSTLAGHRLADGAPVWTAELLGGPRLMGMGTDGDDLYYVTENATRESNGAAAHLVAVDGRSGSERWHRASGGRLGAPVARNGRVFVPFRFQSLAILDGANGTELARIRSREETLSWVRDTPHGILYGGSSGIYRLDSKAVSGSQRESTFVSVALPSRVSAGYWWDGYNAALSGYTAYDRNRLVWQLAPQSNAFQNDTVVLHSYRFFFALDSSVRPKDGAPLRWAYTFPRQDVVASELTSRVLVIASATGDLVALDVQTGTPLLQKQLKLQVQGVTFDLEGYSPPAASAAAVKADIRRALTEAIWDPDRRFGAVKLFCVEQLARLSGGNIAEDLLKIVTHHGIDPAVYKRAGEMIVARHDKASIPLYLKTLEQHYSFVEGTRSTAVDVIAQALGALRASEAVRPLLLHLADHETPLPALAEVVRALVAIGDKSVVEPFRDFLLTYRCDPSFEKSPEALTLVASALLEMGGENERQLLSFVENDLHTLKSLRTYLVDALKQPKSPGMPRKARKAEAGTRKPN